MPFFWESKKLLDKRAAIQISNGLIYLVSKTDNHEKAKEVLFRQHKEISDFNWMETDLKEEIDSLFDSSFLKNLSKCKVYDIDEHVPWYRKICQCLSSPKQHENSSILNEMSTCDDEYAVSDNDLQDSSFDLASNGLEQNCERNLNVNKCSTKYSDEEQDLERNECSSFPNLLNNSLNCQGDNPHYVLDYVPSNISNTFEVSSDIDINDFSPSALSIDNSVKVKHDKRNQCTRQISTKYENSIAESVISLETGLNLHQNPIKHEYKDKQEHCEKQENCFFDSSMTRNQKDIDYCTELISTFISFDSTTKSIVKNPINFHKDSFPCECFSMLLIPGVGKVVKNEKVNGLLGNVCKFLSDASQNLKSINEKFEFIPSPIGSMAEGCKCGYPDEFDVRLDLINIKNEGNILTCENIDVLKAFYNHFQCILHEIPMAAFDESFKFIFFGFKEDGHGYMRLFFSFCMNEGEEPILIKIDLVPAVIMHSQLNCGINIFDRGQGISHSMVDIDPLGQPILRLWHCIAKYHLETKNVTTVPSVCQSEITFLHSLPEEIKNGYVLCKIITLVCDLNGITSYILKNTLFHCLHNDYDELAKQAPCTCKVACDDKKRITLNVAYKIMKNVSDQYNISMRGKLFPEKYDIGPFFRPKHTENSS